jgi:Ca-activated chloride channel homolog
LKTEFPLEKTVLAVFTSTLAGTVRKNTAFADDFVNFVIFPSHTGTAKNDVDNYAPALKALSSRHPKRPKLIHTCDFIDPYFGVTQSLLLITQCAPRKCVADLQQKLKGVRYFGIAQPELAMNYLRPKHHLSSSAACGRPVMNLFQKCLVFSALIYLSAAFAQDTDQDREALDAITVTGTRISAGGAQDINYFRSAAEAGEMPMPESLTVEGLLGEHDLNLPLSRPCAQLLCLATETLAQGLPSRPADLMFVGLGFTSNIDASTWHRAPLNLIAVVDKSGSMDGEPLALVRQALTNIAVQLKGNDQLTIVLYGDTSHVYLEPTRVAEARTKVIAEIANIESAGSTSMEAGLSLGFATARRSASSFAGNTRVMLFTDEQPNVGATDAESFMGMAKAGSRDKIGMTTIGVGVQFDAVLAGKIGSVRGGNLFFVDKPETAEKLFKQELDTMVSEIAHDVKIQMTPSPGYKISGVFGVPDAMLESVGDGVVQVIVPTAFVSTQAGGVFLSLAKSDARANLPSNTSALNADTLLRVSLHYLSAQGDKTYSDDLSVMGPNLTATATVADAHSTIEKHMPAPSAQIREAFALVDQFLSMREASIAYHRLAKPKVSFAILSALKNRLLGAKLESLAAELTLVTAMTDKAALMSGYQGEASSELRARQLTGSWQVKSVRGNQTLRRGDHIFFDDENQLWVTRRNGDAEEAESFAFDGQLLRLPESQLVLHAKMSDPTKLRLSERNGRVAIELTREQTHFE